MKQANRKSKLTNRIAADARPGPSEYTVWDRSLNHFGLRVYPSGVRSFIVQIRVNGRLRKFTLGRYPAISATEARRRGAELLARIWAGQSPAPARQSTAPLFRNYAVRYRKQRKGRWKPSSLETYDIYMRNRLMPHFGRLRLDAIDHAGVSAWFDACSADNPGAANRAYEILRAMLNTARQWGELDDSVLDACAHIVKNPSKPVARCLNPDELERLGAVLDRLRRNRSLARRGHPPAHSHGRATFRSGKSEMGGNRRTVRRRFNGPTDRFQDGAPYDLARPRRSPRHRTTSSRCRRRTGLSPRLNFRLCLPLLVPGAGARSTTRPSHPRLPTYLGFTRSHQWRQLTNGRPASWASQTANDRDLCTSRRRCSARCRRPDRGYHRQSDGIHCVVTHDR